MLKQLRILATSLAAFYTICAPLTAQAEESSSQSAALISNIRTNQKGNWTETVELIFDYLFLLKEEGKTSKERVEALLALYEPDPVNKGLFKFSAVSCAHWLMVLKDFHVENFDDIRLLNQALAKFVDAGIQNVPSQDSAWLLNLGRSVLKVEASSKDALKVKVSTLRQLALLTQKDKYVGRQLGVNALEQMADCGDVSEYERRDLISRVFLSYTGEQPGGNDDGDLLFRDVIAAAKIVHQTKSRYDFSNLDGIYNEVCRRCTDEQALAAQRVLVEEAHLVGLDGEPLHALLLQLTNALLSAGRLDEAVDVLSKQIKKPQPIDKLVLSACLLKQSKYAAAEKLAHQVAETRFPINERYPSHYVAMASAIRAHALIEQRNYFGAIELLIHADSWFSKSLARQHEETEGKYPFFKDLLPSDTSILSDLAMVYEKTGRKSKADRTRQALAKLKLEKERNSLAVETNALTQLASSESGETLATVKNAKRFIGICPQFEKVPEKRFQLILRYIEALIRSGKLISAQMCIDACSGAAYAPTNSQPKLRARIIVDNILLKIEKDNLVEANELMKGFLADAEAKAAIDDLRFAEVDARLSLLAGDYAQAEVKSRVLQNALDAHSEKPTIKCHSSPRDEFVTLQPDAILDRVQTLNQLKRFSQAAKLSRLLLLNSDRFVSRRAADCAANLAYAYMQEGHIGLSDACAQEAAFKDFSSISLAPSRYMADAKDKLAQLSERRNNTVRAKRYRAEAQAMRTQAQALTTQSTVPSDQDAIAGLILEQNDRGAPTVASKSSAISALTVGSSRVVKIGATWTKGQNLEEMQALLRGPKGTKVDISCLDTNGSFATETIELKSPEQFKPPHFYSPMGYFERVELSSSNPSGQNEVSSVMHLLGEGAALQSQAICANLLHGYPYGYNKPQLVQFIKSCPSVAKFFISSARFDRLIEVRNFVEKQLAENRGYISDDELKAADETLEALKPYISNDDLQALQESVKNAHQASEQKKTSQAFVQKGSQKGDLAIGFKPHIWFDGPLFIVQPSKFSLHEKLLQQLYADASGLFSRGQFRDARLVLIDAIKKFDDEADAEEQVNFERAMPISRSDFFVLLAAAEARLGNTDNATAAINKAITKITDALGPSSPCLAVPLAVRKVIEAKTPALLTNEMLGSNLSNSFVDLKTESYRAYRAIQVKDFNRALQIIQSMLDLESGKRQHFAADVSKLISLANFLAKNGQPEEALSLLKKLTPFLQDYSLVLLRVNQCAEIALLEDGTKNSGAKNSHNAWANLEAALADATSPSTSKSNASDFQSLETNNQERLRTLGICYLLGGEPQKAEKILKHGLEKHHVDGFPERRLRIDYALCLLNLDRIEEAKNAIDNSFKLVRLEDGYGFPQNLARVARKFELMGKPDEAIKLLERGLSVDSIAKYSQAKCYYSIELATLYMNNGNPEKATAIFESVGDSRDDTVMFRDWNLRYADLLERSGKKTDALQQCLSMLRNDWISPQERVLALGPALRLLNEGVKLSEEDVDALGNFHVWLHLHPNDRHMISTLADIAKKQGWSEKSQKKIDEFLVQFGLFKVDPVAAMQVELAQQVKKRDLENVIKSLRALQKTKENATHMRQMDNPGNLIADIQFELLMNAGEYEALKEIIVLSIRARTELFPEPGDRAINSKGILVNFYAHRSQPAEALKAFASLAKELDNRYEMSKLVNTERHYDGAFVMPLEAAKVFVAHKDFDTAEKIALQCQALQEKWLGEESLYKVETLKVLALIYEKKGQLQKAEDALRKAFEITCWNRGYLSNYSQIVRPQYAAILRLRGKSAAADEVANLKAENDSPPTIDWEYGPYLRSFHSPPPEHFKDSAESQLKQWLPKAIQVSGHLGAERVLDYLVRFYKDRNNLEETQKYLLQKLEIWNLVEGKCSVNQSKVMLELARNEFNRKNEKAAFVWLLKAETEDSLTPNIYDTPQRLVAYADLYADLGNKSKANSLGRRALLMLEERSYFPAKNDLQILKTLQKVISPSSDKPALSRVQNALQKVEALNKR